MMMTTMMMMIMRVMFMRVMIMRVMIMMIIRMIIVMTMTMMIKHTDRYVMFFGRSSIYSNFHSSPFTLDNIRFNCVEQAYQHRKALDAGDTKAASDILATKDPVTQKHVGDKVKAKNKKWEKNEGLTFMQKAVTAKFSHNEQFKAELLSTKGKCFVECNPHDKIWSCGLKLDDPKSSNAANWTGLNQLGLCLDEARRSLS